MTTHIIRSAAWLSLCGLLLSLTTGCSRWIELMALPEAESTAPQTITRDEQVPLVMERLRVTRNGSPQNPSSETEQRVLGTLQDLALFSRLIGSDRGDVPDDQKIVRARLAFDEAIDPHAGDAAWKGIVIGASMFLLAPAIPLEYDYAAHVTLELERWDGQVKRYESQSAGTARYHLFGATPIVIDELKGHVTESALTMLSRQVAQDTAFFYASSAPLSASGIRSVSVKPAAPTSPAAPISVIPVSISPTP